MKLATVIVGSAVALVGWDPKSDVRVVDTWNGYNYDFMDTNCGMTYDDEDTSIVNHTCTIKIPDNVDATFDSLYVGNGAFVVAMNSKIATVTGFQGASTTMQYNAVFTQPATIDGMKENATCWRSTVECVSDGDFGHARPLLMESINAKNGANKYNFQAIGHWGSTVMTVSLVGDSGMPLSLANVSCSDCQSFTVNQNTITFVLNENYSTKQTFGFEAITDATPNMWKSSVVVA